jgi:hypothetical protein
MKKVGSALGILGSLLLASLSTAEAYPIFYSCDSNGRANDTLDTKDIQKKVLAALATPSSDSEIAEICKGEAECFSVMKQAFFLTVDSTATVNRLFEAEVAEIEARKAELAEDLKIDSSISATARNLIVMANAINDCRISQQNRDPLDFAVQNRYETDRSSGYDIFLLHGVNNEYNPVMGIGRDEKSTHKLDYDQISNVIHQAVASNFDPYTALAISFLESGQPKTFVLDMAPSVEMLGCKTTPVAKLNDENKASVDAKEAQLRASGQSFIYTWGTFSTFTPDGGKPDSHANKNTREIYAQMQRTKGKTNQKIEYDGPSLACFQNEGGFLAKADGTLVKNYNEQVSDSTFSVKKACCMRIPYASYTAFSAMANIHARNTVSRNEDPMIAIQRFNGLGVIGLTEKAGVGAFRYGMQMSKDPQYGAQGMDFVVNSFMGNPAIRAIVAQAEEKYETKPKSILCAGKSAGTYSVDSEKYVDRQLAMKRLRTAVGKSWGDLGGLHQQMVAREFDFVTEFTKSGKSWQDYPGLSRAENDQLRAAGLQLSKITGSAAKWDYYQKNVYPYRDTLGKVSKYSWSRFTDKEIQDFRQRIKAAPSQDMMNWMKSQ